MATLYRTTGFQEQILPLNHVSFSLEEMQTLVGGYIQMAFTHDGKVIVLDEEGKLKGKAVNHVATTHYRFGSHDHIVGEALVGSPSEMGYHDND